MAHVSCFLHVMAEALGISLEFAKISPNTKSAQQRRLDQYLQSWSSLRRRSLSEVAKWSGLQEIARNRG